MKDWTLQDWANIVVNFTKGVSSLFTTGKAWRAAAAIALHSLKISGLYIIYPNKQK